MKDKVFVQLYSLVRQEREGHLEAFRKLAEIGYDGIEILGNNTNGLAYEDYKKLLQDLGLKVLSSHNLHTEEDYAFAAGLGAKYGVIAGCDVLRDRDELQKYCDHLNEQGRIMAKYGMKAVMHNHGEEFCWIDEEAKDERIYDYIAEHTDPEFVGMELDVGWVVRADVDPVEYIKKYPGRFPLIHIKECTVPARNFEELEHFPTRVLQLGEPKFVNGVPYFTDEQKRMLDESRMWNVELGKGIVDFPGIIKAADAQGCEAYISERENYHIPSVPDSDPVKCAALDYQYLRSL